MAMQEIAQAIERVRGVMQRRPAAGLHPDAPATARWEGGLRVVSSNANGARIATDMPVEIGGSGDQLPPGWLLRAAVASCAATRIAMEAAATGVELAALEVEAASRSDTRGLLGMADADGTPVGAGPCEVRLTVRVRAPGIPAEQLRALIAQAHRCSPVSSVLKTVVPLALRIDVDGEGEGEWSSDRSSE